MARVETIAGASIDAGGAGIQDGGRIEIKGLKELNKLLSDMPVKLETNILRGGLRAGMKVVAEQARANLRAGGHVKSGRLLNSIRVGSAKKGNTVFATVKVGNKQAWYAHFIERGTKPHTITGKNGGKLTMPDGTKVYSVEHPGTPPRPFVRPALDEKAQAALAAMADYMRSRIAAEMKKQGLPMPEFKDDAS